MRKLLFFFCFSCFFASAQVPQPSVYWLKTIGGNNITQVGKFVLGTSDGGFIVGISSNALTGTGNVDSFCAINGQRNIFAKYNSDATSIDWVKCYEINGDTSLDYLFPQSDGGVVLGGTCTGWGYYICKQDASGNIVWSHEYSKGSGLGLTCMIATSDGGYIMGGGSFYTDSNVYIHYGSWMDADVFIIKLDSNGNKQWTKVVGGSDGDLLYAIVEGMSNSYYILGSLASSDYDCTGNHGGPDGYIARLDSGGSLMWHRDVGGSSGDGLSSAITTPNGGIILVGTTYSSDGNVTNHKGSGENFWLIKMDTAGNILWDSCYGGSGNCYPNGICRASDGSIWMAGISNAKTGEIDSAYGGDDAWFMHADSTGKFIDAKVLGSHNDDRGMMIWPLSNGHVLGGGYCLAGDGTFASTTFYGGFDGFLVDFGPFIERVPESFIPNVNIYPNPAKEVVHVAVPNGAQMYIAIGDVLGRVVHEQTLNGETTINTSTWEKGLYCMRITDENGRSATRMLSVE